MKERIYLYIFVVLLAEVSEIEEQIKEHEYAVDHVKSILSRLFIISSPYSLCSCYHFVIPDLSWPLKYNYLSLWRMMRILCQNMFQQKGMQWRRLMMRYGKCYFSLNMDENLMLHFKSGFTLFSLNGFLAIHLWLYNITLEVDYDLVFKYHAVYLIFSLFFVSTSL